METDCKSKLKWYVHANNHITRKRFSEKPIVAFANSTVFLQDFCILLNLWSHVLALSAWTLNSKLPESLSPD